MKILKFIHISTFGIPPSLFNSPVGMTGPDCLGLAMTWDTLGFLLLWRGDSLANGPWLAGTFWLKAETLMSQIKAERQKLCSRSIPVLNLPCAEKSGVQGIKARYDLGPWIPSFSKCKIWLFGKLIWDWAVEENTLEFGNIPDSWFSAFPPGRLGQKGSSECMLGEMEWWTQFCCFLLNGPRLR